jgi:hypothetical protein
MALLGILCGNKWCALELIVFAIFFVMTPSMGWA